MGVYPFSALFILVLCTGFAWMVDRRMKAAQPHHAFSRLSRFFGVIVVILGVSEGNSLQFPYDDEGKSFSYGNLEITGRMTYLDDLIPGVYVVIDCKSLKECFELNRLLIPINKIADFQEGLAKSLVSVSTIRKVSSGYETFRKSSPVDINGSNVTHPYSYLVKPLVLNTVDRKETGSTINVTFNMFHVEKGKITSRQRPVLLNVQHLLFIIGYLDACQTSVHNYTIFSEEQQKENERNLSKIKEQRGKEYRVPGACTFNLPYSLISIGELYNTILNASPEELRVMGGLWTEKQLAECRKLMGTYHEEHQSFAPVENVMGKEAENGDAYFRVTVKLLHGENTLTQETIRNAGKDELRDFNAIVQDELTSQFKEISRNFEIKDRILKYFPAKVEKINGVYALHYSYRRTTSRSAHPVEVHMYLVGGNRKESIVTVACNTSEENIWKDDSAHIIQKYDFTAITKSPDAGPTGEGL